MSWAPRRYAHVQSIRRTFRAASVARWSAELRGYGAHRLDNCRPRRYRLKVSILFRQKAVEFTMASVALFRPMTSRTQFSHMLRQGHAAFEVGDVIAKEFGDGEDHLELLCIRDYPHTTSSVGAMQHALYFRLLEAIQLSRMYRIFNSPSAARARSGRGHIRRTLLPPRTNLGSAIAARVRTLRPGLVDGNAWERNAISSCSKGDAQGCTTTMSRKARWLVARRVLVRSYLQKKHRVRAGPTGAVRRMVRTPISLWSAYSHTQGRRM